MLAHDAKVRCFGKDSCVYIQAKPVDDNVQAAPESWLVMIRYAESVQVGTCNGDTPLRSEGIIGNHSGR